VSLVLDLLITHERWGSSSDPTLQGSLHYPNDVDRSLNETVTDKIRKYVCLLLLQTHRETDRFFAVSGVHLAKPTSGLFHFPRTVFFSQFRTKVGSTEASRVNLNLDGVPITSRTHTHPSHSQTSRLLTSSLSLSVPVPRGTQCM
jgi:hypothetical protein